MKYMNNHYGQSKIFGKRMNLQLFAEEPGASGGAAPADDGHPGNQTAGQKSGTTAAGGDKKPADDGKGNAAGNEPPDDSKKDDAKVYTKADLDAAVKDAKNEAEKLAKMNAEQKRQYELEKAQNRTKELEDQVAQLQKEALKAGLSKEASRILQEEHNIVATQDMLDFVVGDDAEQTNKLIKKLVGIIEADRKAVETARATGRTPKNYTNNGNTMSEIDKRIAKYE